MKKNGILIVSILILCFLIYWFFIGKGCQKQLSEEERQALMQDSAKSDNAQPNDIAVFPNTPVGNQLRDHMMVLAMPAETIEEADAKYRESLAALRENPAEVVTLLNEAYNKTEARHYFNRWGLVKTLGDIESNLADKILYNIAASKIPPETSEDLHHFSTQEEEVIIRIRAIEGLGLLAQKQNRFADTALLQLIFDSTGRSSAIQLRAIKAYLRAGKDTGSREKFLKSRLDKSLHDIITTGVTAPEEFSTKMEGIKKLSDKNTKSEKAERAISTETVSPKIKSN